MIRRVFGWLGAAGVGAVFALAFVGAFDPDLVRLAWAVGPNLLYSAARADGTAFTAGADGVVAVGGLDAAGALNVASPTDPFPVATPAGAEIDVDLIKVGGNAVTAGAGAVAAGTLRATLASNDPAVVDLAALEVLATTIAGDTTSIDGKLPAALGGGAEAGALLVTVAPDSTGLVSVDDNGASLTVDATELAPLPVKGVDLPTPAHATLTCVPARDSYTSNALDAEVWVSSVDEDEDVCITFGTPGTANIAAQATCDLVLGPYAGAGTRTTVALPIGMVGSFECHAVTNAVVVVTSMRRGS